MDNMNLPFVTVIVVNYNGKPFLPACLGSLAGIDYPRDKLEVILVDNNSSDGSVAYIKENFHWVKVLQLDKNLGKMLEKRRTVQKNRKRPDTELYKLGVIATLMESIKEEMRLNKVWRDEYYRN
jgi:cellulose synthase/poly-beta-1,6-N-acetylglucosamine synthase-like glycosyltransferase